MYNEITGDLIDLALRGSFDVIGHGVNCFCTQKRGLAHHIGDINKLGNIRGHIHPLFTAKEGVIMVYNLYTQYDWRGEHPLDYEALTLCLRKLNHVSKGKHIGLPKLGSGLAKGSWERIKQIIRTELKDCTVTVVIFDK